MNKAEYKKSIIRIAISVVVILAITVTAAAEFTKSYRAKRVIAAYESNGMLFSSNHLVASAELEFSSIEVDKVEALSGSIPSFDVIVTICNYAQGNPAQFYGKTINYNLDASIVQVTPDEFGHPVASPAAGTLPAVLMDGEPLQARYTGSLSGGVMSEDVYTLTLPRSMLSGEKYYVLLTAAPTGGSYADLSPIAKLFELTVRAEATASDWSVIATDDRSNPIGDYAGYNFRLSGSGRGTVTLGWDASKLEINKVFKDAVSAVTPASLPAGWTGLTAIEFDVDAADVNSYDIQFYPASEGAVTTWSDVAVSMIFEEATAP
ncbi:MAG: hypothetical protein J5940_03070 [Clostridia bacterium]|nr:hypothetical protein [Clostridia bacterium]